MQEIIFVRSNTHKGHVGEHPECQTPTLVDKTLIPDYVSPHWRTTFTQFLSVIKDLENLPPLLLYSKPVKRWAAPACSHSCSVTTPLPRETEGCYQLGAIVTYLLGQLFWDSEILPATLTEVHLIYGRTTLH